MSAGQSGTRKWPIVLLVFLILFVAVVGTLAWHARRMDDFTRAWVVHELQRRFGAQVELAKLHVAIFPEMMVTGEDLVIHQRNRPDTPPFIHIDKFIFRLGVLGIFRVPHHLAAAKVENMTITIPPRREEKQSPSTSSANLAQNQRFREVIVDEVVCDDADLVILPKNPAKEPLDWKIHDLTLHYVSVDRPFRFIGTLTNAKPKGEIATEGYFGPWDLDDPGSTPVSGSYKFTDADLDPFPGIGGTLSSTGNYSGLLDSLGVEGVTDTPNFSLDKVGKPVPLHTEYSATVDGTNGDTYLHSVRATLIRSLIFAKGSIVKEEKKGHQIMLDVSAPNARIEDILSLAINSSKPMLSGPAKIKAKLFLPPGKQKMLDKMILDGQFGIDDANWSSPEIRAKLESLSRHAEGHPADEDAGSSVSDLQGRFHLEKGVMTFSQLTFRVAGAAIELAGTYKMREGDLDFQGHLRLQAKISQTVSGKKSFFLKVFDPFFSKNGAGTDLPITISGNREHPTFGVSIFHKKINKQLGGEKSSGNGSSDQNKSH